MAHLRELPIPAGVSGAQAGGRNILDVEQGHFEWMGREHFRLAKERDDIVLHLFPELDSIPKAWLSDLAKLKGVAYHEEEYSILALISNGRRTYPLQYLHPMAPIIVDGEWTPFLMPHVIRSTYSPYYNPHLELVADSNWITTIGHIFNGNEPYPSSYSILQYLSLRQLGVLSLCLEISRFAPGEIGRISTSALSGFWGRLPRLELA